MIRSIMVSVVLLWSSAALALGGDFQLTDQHGKVFRLSDHQDKVIALFFGYTHCPDICPDTLSTVGSALSMLNDPDDVQVVFVSVDPSRDSPQHLNGYLAYFDERYIGVTGSWSDLKRIARQWNARFNTPEKPVNKGYFVDHSADVYVIERGGKVHGIVPYGLPAEHLANVLQGALSLNENTTLVSSSLVDLNGLAVEVVGQTDRATVLHFWASWCVPCREEFSDLEAAKPTLAKLPTDFYAVNLGDRQEGIHRFLADYPLSYAMLSDRTGISERRWGVKTLPLTVVFSPDGKELVRFSGAQSWLDESFVEELSKYLR